MVKYILGVDGGNTKTDYLDIIKNHNINITVIKNK